MSRQRKERVSSDSLQAHNHVGRDYPGWPIEIPMPKRHEKEAMSIFESILTVRASHDWGADVLLVAEFSAITCRIGEANRQIDEHGLTSESEGSNGQPVIKPNPLTAVVSQFGARQNQIARLLGFSGLPSSKKSILNHAQSFSGTLQSEKAKAKPKSAEQPDWASLAEIK